MIKLIETFNVVKNTMQELPLTESVITEKASGKVLETKKKYRVPISRYDFLNLNERIYPKNLWEGVINSQKQMWEGSFALADHPMEEGSFKDIVGVWSNLHIDESAQLVKADITFVGNYGKMATEILEAGGKVGFSSSGFGDLKEDGKTVDPSTYQIERIADCVLNPSQQVFGTIQDAIEEKVENKKSETVLKENNTMSSKKYSKLEERKLRTDIDTYLTEALSITNLHDRLDNLEEVVSYFDSDSPVDLKEKVNAEIEKTRTEIKESSKVIESLKETFGTANPDEFKEGFTKLAIDKSLYERQTEDWKKLAESLQAKIVVLNETIQNLPTQDMYEQVVEQVQKNKSLYSQRVSMLKDKLAKNEQAFDINAQTYKQMVKELNTLVKENKTLETEKAKLTEEISFYARENKELRETITLKNKAHAQKVTELTALPNVKPRPTRDTMFEGFNESSEVQAYFNDLVKQHGNKIVPYKERILGCKTLFEAMRIYTVAMDEMTRNLYTQDVGDYATNKKLVEAATGYKIATGNGMKKPKGWE